MKSQNEALDQQMSSQRQWTTTFGAAIEDQRREAAEGAERIDGQLERLVQDENVFATEEIAKNMPTGE